MKTFFYINQRFPRIASTHRINLIRIRPKYQYLRENNKFPFRILHFSLRFFHELRAEIIDSSGFTGVKKKGGGSRGEMGRGWKKDVEKKGNRESGGRLARENASRCTLSCIRRIHLHRFPLIDPPDPKKLAWESFFGGWLCFQREMRGIIGKIRKEGFSIDLLRAIAYFAVSFAIFSLFFLSRYRSSWNLYFHSSRNKSTRCNVFLHESRTYSLIIVGKIWNCLTKWIYFYMHIFENKNIITNTTLFNVFFLNHQVLFTIYRTLFKNFDTV